MTGGSCTTMQLEAYTKDNKLVCPLKEDNALLGSYPLENGMRLHIIDKFSIRNELDFGAVEKYEISTEEYAKKTDTVRAFLQKNKLGSFEKYFEFYAVTDLQFKGQYNEDYIKKKEQHEQEEKNKAESIEINSRCKVTIPNAPSRFGKVMYAGKVEGLSGYWIGVYYDEPLGKNNGTLVNLRFFLISY